MDISKTRSSFYRRLYVAHLIEQGIDSVPAIIEATGMPRRTAQDTLTALAELDIDCRFNQEQGARHNSGGYYIHSWGPINPKWVKQNLPLLKEALSYP